MNSLIDTLETIVNVPSVTGQEGRLCTHIAERMGPVWGLDGIKRIGNSLVVGQRTGRPLISLYGHLDTVPVQGNGIARIEGDTMYGLGTSDMKSGVAVMLHLLEDAAIRSGPFDVVGVFYDREEGPADENGLEAVLDRAEWLEQSEFAIVLEPTDLNLELGCSGAMNATVSFIGTSSHSARPWHGVNAITKAGWWLTGMYEREPVPVTVAGLVFREVFSVTTAAGGIANNVIPARFDVNLNYRFPPTYSMEEAEQRLRDATLIADEVEIIDRAPAGTIDESNPHMQRLQALTGANREAKQGWTDVARLTSRGIAAVNYGPGIVAQAHQVGEHVKLASLDVAFENLRRFLSTI